MTTSGKIAWSGALSSVQPRIRLTRPCNQRGHTYQPCMLRLRGTIGDDFGDLESMFDQALTEGFMQMSEARSMRVALGSMQIEAALSWLEESGPQDCQCLALAVLATRHGGLGRNRGRGHLRLTLDGDLEQTRARAGGAQ